MLLWSRHLDSINDSLYKPYWVTQIIGHRFEFTAKGIYEK